MAECVSRQQNESTVSGDSALDVVKCQQECEEHPLSTPMSMWYSLASWNFVNFDNALRLIGEFSTVEQFWSVYSFCIRPAHLDRFSDYYVFRQGVRPMWEDSANRLGGKLVLRQSKSVISLSWEKLLLAFVGHQFLDHDEICGVCVSVRTHHDMISVWNRHANNSEAISRIGQHMCALTGCSRDKLEYKMHQNCLHDGTSFKNSTKLNRFTAQ